MNTVQIKDIKGNVLESLNCEGGIVKNKHFPGLTINFNKCKNNKIKLYFPISFIDSKIEFNGDGHVFEMNSTDKKVSLTVTFFDSNSKMIVGTNLYCGGLLAIISENNTYIKIGNDCLLSEGIHLRTADGHSIFDLGCQKVLNKPCAGIEIGNHVWISRNVFFGKDSGCADDSVIGYGAIVTKKYDQPNVVIAGVPAKIIHQNIGWSYDSCSKFEKDREEVINCDENAYPMPYEDENDCLFSKYEFDRGAQHFRNKCILEYKRTQSLPRKKNNCSKFSCYMISDQNHLKYASVTMTSILENNPDMIIDFYLMTDEKYSEESQKKLYDIANQYNSSIEVLEIYNPAVCDFIINPLWPKSQLLQLIPHKYLPTNVKYVLYVDVDAIIVNSLSEISEMDMGNCLIAGAHPYYQSTYQNTIGSGFVYYNLEEMRKRDISLEQFLECNRNLNNYSIAENFLNGEMYDESVVLDTYRYNCNLKILLDLKVDDFPIKPVVIHYCTDLGGIIGKKPWSVFINKEEKLTEILLNNNISNISAKLYSLWWKYAKKSPFYDEIISQSKCEFNTGPE